MWSVQVERVGPGAALQYVEETTTEAAGECGGVPGKGLVPVRFLASAVNHVDTFVVSGAYKTQVPLPFVPGRDLVGLVESDCADFVAGERVWTGSMGHAGRQGVLREVAYVPTDRLYRLPENADPIAAAAVLHGGATADLGLFQIADLRRGQTVYIAGAGGSVGGAALQMAVEAGASVVTSSSEKDIAWCLSQGASDALDYRDPDLIDRLAARAGGAIDIWWDQSGRQQLTESLPLMHIGGTILLTAGMGQVAPLPVGELYTRDLSLRGFAISNARATNLALAARRLNRLLAAERLQPREVIVMPVSEAANAYQLVEEGKAPGKVVLVADD